VPCWLAACKRGVHINPLVSGLMSLLGTASSQVGDESWRVFVATSVAAFSGLGIGWACASTAAVTPAAANPTPGRCQQQQKPSSVSDRGWIGIIGGSGPEAGVDLMSKILRAHRSELGERFRTDRDAPNVLLMSVSQVGGPRTAADIAAGSPRYEVGAWSTFELMHY
jgi:hypothetical protein